MRREGLLQRRTQLGSKVDVAEPHVHGLSGDDVGNQALLVCLAFDRQHGARANSRELVQLMFDFAQLDTETPDLHLAVRPPHELEIAVCPQAYDVACTVQPDLGLAVHDEPARGEFWSVEVTSREADTGDMQFAGRARGNKLAIVGKNVKRGIAKSLADMRHLSCNPRPGGIDTALGRAIHVEGLAVVTLLPLHQALP
ncbi:hypothetical protein D3C71_810820 [compost metagenome]